jgi:hypothetical protein
MPVQELSNKEHARMIDNPGEEYQYKSIVA